MRKEERRMNREANAFFCNTYVCANVHDTSFALSLALSLVFYLTCVLVLPPFFPLLPNHLAQYKVQERVYVEAQNNARENQRNNERPAVIRQSSITSIQIILPPRSPSLSLSLSLSLPVRLFSCLESWLKILVWNDEITIHIKCMQSSSQVDMMTRQKVKNVN